MNPDAFINVSMLEKFYYTGVFSTLNLHQNLHHLGVEL